MSWGERSCIWSNKSCPDGIVCEMHTCNVNCKAYEHDGTTEPDSNFNVYKDAETKRAPNRLKGKALKKALKRKGKRNDP